MPKFDNKDGYKGARRADLIGRPNLPTSGGIPSSITEPLMEAIGINQIRYGIRQKNGNISVTTKARRGLTVSVLQEHGVDTQNGIVFRPEFTEAIYGAAAEALRRAAVACVESGYTNEVPPLML